MRRRGKKNFSCAPIQVPQEVRSALSRFRRRVRAVRALRGIGITLTLAAALCGVALALDRFLVLPGAARWIVSLAAAGLPALCALATVVLPLLRPIPDLRAARALEAAAPALEESLLSALELARDGAPGASPQLLDALGRTAAARAARLDMARLVDPRRSLRPLLIAAAAHLGLLGFAAWDFRGFALLARRLFQPGKDLPRPTRVALHVRPGIAVIGVDDDLAVEAAVERGAPPSAAIRWRVPGGEWGSAAMEERSAPAGTAADPSGPSSPLGAARPGRGFRHEFRRARQPFEYQVLAGDWASPVFRVEVRERPRPERFTILYTYPSYTRRPPATVRSSRGDLSAVAGSAADLEVECSGGPVAARRIERGSGSAAPFSVEPGPGGRSLVRGRIEIRRSGAYSIFLEGPDGIANRGGETYSILAEPDRPPGVKVLSPRDLEVVVEDSSRLEIRYQAQDDFGLEDLALAAGQDGERFPIALEAAVEGGRIQASGVYRWDLAALGLRPGDSTAFRLEARDGLGQVGSSPEMALRRALHPGPPEGPDWLPGLREIQKGLDRALAEWSALGDPPGPDRPASFAADPARAERLGRSAEDILRQIARLRLLGDAAAALGWSIPVPSVHRDALALLGQSLRRVGEEEGKRLWRECLAAAGRMREILRAAGQGSGESAAGEVKAAAIQEALDRGAGKLARAAARLAAIHRFERLESALELLRAILPAELEIAARLREAPAERAAAERKTTARLQRGIRIEAAILGAELDAAARIGGAGGDGLAAIAKEFLERLMPLLEEAQDALEAPGGFPEGAIDSIIGALRRAEEGLGKEIERLGEAARSAREGLQEAPRFAERFAALAAGESEAAAALEAGGLPAAEAVAAGDQARRGEIALLRQSLDDVAEMAGKGQPADFESAGDILAVREIFRDVSEGILAGAASRTEEIRLALAAAEGKKPSAEDLKPVIADRRRAAGILEGLARASGGILEGAALGRRARQLDGIAEAEEAVAWQLRSTAREHGRSLRARARAQDGIAELLLEIEASLEAAAKDAAAGSEPARALAEALAALPAASRSVSEAAGACRAADPARALDASLEAARAAGKAAHLVEEARSALPRLAAARGWVRRQLGSLPERAEKLAQAERAHAGSLRRLAAELETQLAAAGGPGGSGSSSVAPQQPEMLAAAGLEQENLREEAARIAGAASRESGKLAALPARGGPRGSEGLALVLRALDFAAGRLVDLARGEMLRASKAVDAAARTQDAAPQKDILLQAAAEEDRAAEGIAEVARSLRILDQREAAEESRKEIEDLLAAPRPPAGEPPSLEKVLALARAYLDGALRAAEALSTKLPEGVLKAEVLGKLREAAGKFQEALAAGEAGAGEGAGARAAALVEEGRALLAEAAALVRRIRGEADDLLAKTVPAGERGGARSAGSRELQEVYAELERIRALRDRQAQVEAEIEELLRDPGRGGADEKMRELAKVAEEIAGEMGARFLSSEELMELVADLLAAGNEARRIGEAERRLRAELPGEGEDPPKVAPLRERQEALAAGGGALSKKLRGMGSALTVNLPAVLKAFWEAEARLEPALAAMEEARAALGAARLPAADEGLRKAASELEALSDLLGAARRKALEEIAEREDGRSGLDLGESGLEAAMDAVRRSAEELSRGRLDGALSLQQSARRGLTSAAEALGARLGRMRFDPGGEGFSLAGATDGAAGIPGLPWEVLLRGDEPGPASREAGQADDSSADISEAFPEEYRELVRIYLRALAAR